MFYSYLVISITVFVISLIYLKFKPQVKPVRWMMVTSGAVVTIIITPIILAVVGFTWEIMVLTPVRREQFEEDYEKAGEIVDSLKEFHAINDDYPSELSNLVPDYLITLPPEPYSERYHYQLSEDGNFTFTFYASSRVGFNMYCYSRGNDVQCSFFDD